MELKKEKCCGKENCILEIGKWSKDMNERERNVFGDIKKVFSAFDRKIPLRVINILGTILIEKKIFFFWSSQVTKIETTFPLYSSFVKILGKNISMDGFFG